MHQDTHRHNVEKSHFVLVYEVVWKTDVPQERGTDVMRDLLSTKIVLYVRDQGQVHIPSRKVLHTRQYV